MPTSTIKITTGIEIVGDKSRPLPTEKTSDTITNNDGVYRNIISVGTTESSVTFTGITTNGWLAIENLDSTNYMRYGVATGVYTGRVLAGMKNLIYLEPGKTLYVIANTAAVRTRFTHLGSA